MDTVFNIEYTIGLTRSFFIFQISVLRINQANEFLVETDYVNPLGKQSENTPLSNDSPQSTSLSEAMKHDDDVSRC